MNVCVDDSPVTRKNRGEGRLIVKEHVWGAEIHPKALLIAWVPQEDPPGICRLIVSSATRLLLWRTWAVESVEKPVPDRVPDQTGQKCANGKMKEHGLTVLDTGTSDPLKIEPLDARTWSIFPGYLFLAITITQLQGNGPEEFFDAGSGVPVGTCQDWLPTRIACAVSVVPQRGHIALAHAEVSAAMGLWINMAERRTTEMGTLDLAKQRISLTSLSAI